MNSNIKITIQEAEIANLETIVDFNQKMAFETENIILNPNTIYFGVKTGLENPEKARYYLAIVENKIAGSLMITKEWSDWRNCDIAWIQSVYILPEFRRKGIYSALYNHIQQLVYDGKFGGIRLYVDKTNLKAIQTYSNLGMNGEHYQLFEWINSD